MDSESFVFSDDGARLIVRVDLDTHVVDAFGDACQKLLNAAGDEIVIDLTNIGYINSSCMGKITRAYALSKEEIKQLRIKIGGSLVPLFDLMAIRDLIPTEVCE